ncbi:hypothetical protein H5410_022537 [Solanum commersonii]|uniref:Uncharacterized protein n=1 Tax=Solanum commersonii TaxID=4109 RepID=A0A9J5ZHG5_SOLCO|nr:hypothetical protein H5410_022537 [Solanum commersonii]
MTSEKLQALKLQAFSKLKLQLNALTNKFKVDGFFDDEVGVKSFTCMSILCQGSDGLVLLNSFQVLQIGLKIKPILIWH